MPSRFVVALVAVALLAAASLSDSALPLLSTGVAHAAPKPPPPCQAGFPNARQTTIGKTTWWNRQESVRQVLCDHFGLEPSADFPISSSMVCGMLAQVIGKGSDKLGLFADGACSGDDLASDPKEPVKYVSAVCSWASDLLGIALKPAGALGGLACTLAPSAGTALGAALESVHEFDVAVDVVRHNKCIKYSPTHFGSPWLAEACSSDDKGFTTLPRHKAGVVPPPQQASGGGGSGPGGGGSSSSGPPGTHFGPVTVYPLPSGYRLPYDITAGREGSMWFTVMESGFDAKGGGAIGRVAADGTVSNFPLSYPARPVDIATGPEGNLWFTDPGTSSLGEATPAGQITELPLTGYPSTVPTGVSGGPDGNVWFTTGDGVAKRRPDGEITNYPFPSGYCGSTALPIVQGPEGSLWTGACERIVKVSTGGSFSPITLDKEVDIYDIAASPDNYLWVTAATPNVPWPGGCWIARVSTGGAQKWYELPSEDCGNSLTVGPEGDIWFVQVDSQSIDRMNPTTGAITKYSYPPGWGLYIGGITVGADGAIWGGSYDAVVRIQP